MISSTKKGGWILAALLVTAAATAEPIQVQINGDAVTFPDVPPQRINSIVMVPIRTVFERMGATVEWNNATQKVTCKSAGGDVVLEIGNSEATVNGQMRYLEVPPIVKGDRTLVPMRFLGNALGNEVTWNGDQELVSITTTTTSASTSASSLSTPLPETPTVTLSQYEVIPVTLDTSLSSTENQVGDTFTATVSAGDSNGYASLPSGTKIEGHVAAVQPMTDTQPAVLDLKFDRVNFPNGTSQPIYGSLMSLDDQYVMVGDDGIYQAQSSGKSFDRMVFVGYGSPDGRLVGVNSSSPIDGYALQDDLSDIQAQVPDDQRQIIDITIPAGTDVGVRINNETTLEL